ncbi:MAG: ribonuclease domain-containing protein [Gudongella sp.]|nr:ribonuclease domain-containing protein [Gudongella sp.]
MKLRKHIIFLTVILLLVGVIFTGCSAPVENNEQEDVIIETVIDENGIFSDTESVALYIHTYGKLPKNFLTKSEASEAGWDPQKGNLWEVTEDMSIGGDRFGNREGLLPKEEGRIYYECDVNYSGGFRGSERIVYSNDGLIFYTGDHYESFDQLY